MRLWLPASGVETDRLASDSAWNYTQTPGAFSVASGDGSHYIVHETRPGREVGHAIVLCYAGKCRVHGDSVMQAVEIDAATFSRLRSQVVVGLSFASQAQASEPSEAPDVAERVLDTVALRK